MTLIIAEAGVNHNGQEDLAIKLIDAAHLAGADIVKFQTFKAKNLVTTEAKQADYQIVNTGKVESQFDMLSRLELSFDAHLRLLKHCQQLNIEFLSTAFDLESLEFLVSKLGLTRLKIPSGEITNAPLVLAHAQTGCDLIVSTGMASLADIEGVLGVIAYGYLGHVNTEPSVQAFEEAYMSDEGQKLLREKVTILHCTTEYPAPLKDINLNVMGTLTAAFNLPVGYSDHSEGIVVPIAAVAKGAVLIEKHFTLDKNMEGPDHKASLDPVELKAMVDAIRIVDLVQGNGLKGPQMSELKNKTIARKSLIANGEIKEGDTFTSETLVVKRPGTGLSPYLYWDVLGKRSSKAYADGDLISE